MTETQKKALAEWMGATLRLGDGEYYYRYKQFSQPLSCFSPHTNNTQFLEILGHMTPQERGAVYQLLKDKLPDTAKHFLHAIWIMSHKQEVITALLEVKET